MFKVLTRRIFTGVTYFVTGLLVASQLFMVMPAVTSVAVGPAVETPKTPPELPFEVELELASAGSLKQAPLWKEIIQLLINPYAYTSTNSTNPEIPGFARTANIQRRPAFGANMTPLNIWELERNVLTDEIFRLRTSDGEISWDIAGTLFDPDEVIPTDPLYPGAVVALRTVIGELVYEDYVPPTGTTVINGSLVVRNPEPGDLGPEDPRIPPDGTIVAVPAFGDFGDGLGLYEYDPENGDRTFIGSFVDLNFVINGGNDFLTFSELPINEFDFLEGGTFAEKQTARQAAEALGKALFWDMQVGSDAVQACGTCHFSAGADTRTRNQLNPNINGPLGNAAGL